MGFTLDEIRVLPSLRVRAQRRCEHSAGASPSRSPLRSRDVVSALGLGFLRKDGILWPAMLLALAVAVMGFWQGARTHGRWGPLAIGGVGAVSLAAGVIFVHGFPAMQMIYAGAVALVAGAGWNSYARRSCLS